jgi:hypothetical protein
MLEELKKELENYRSPEKAELTKEEEKILKKMFSVKGSFNALFRYLMILESDKGVKLAYDMESLPTIENDYTPDQIAEEVRFRSMITRFIRLKLEGMRLEFAKDIEEKIKEEEEKIIKIQEKNKKSNKESEQVEKGIPINI